MDTFAPVLVALLLAHLAGDFLLQRQAVIIGRQQRRLGAYAEHGAIHLVCLTAAWWLFVPAPLLASAVWTAFAVIVVSHLAADFIKSTTGPGGGAWQGVAPFLLDQAFHLLVIFAVAWMLGGGGLAADEIAVWWQARSASVAVVLAGYILAVFGVGYFNSLVLSRFNQPDEAGLNRAGLYIGWLERFLMLTAVLLGAYAALGLVLTAKSIFRFDAIRQHRSHAEYFLIGTLISVAEVVIVGALVFAVLK